MTEASTIFCTVSAVNWPPICSVIADSMDFSRSPLVGTSAVAPVTAASTSLAIWSALTPSGTEDATACSTRGLTAAASTLGAGMAAMAASTTVFTSAAVIWSPIWSLICAEIICWISAALAPVSIPIIAESIIFWISPALAPVSVGMAPFTAAPTISAIDSADTAVGCDAGAGSSEPQAMAPATRTTKSAVQSTPFRTAVNVIVTTLLT
jgi:hypothetical protein